MRERLACLVLSLLTAGCASGGITPRGGHAGTSGGPSGGPADVPGDDWMVSVDTTASERYLSLDDGTATVTGVVRATAGADHAEVDGNTLPLDGSDGFTTEVPVPLGLSHVEVRGVDTLDRAAHGDRAVLRAAFRDEGALHPEAIAVSVTDAMLAAMASSALGDLGALDLASFLPPGTTVVSGDPCTIRIVSIASGTPGVSLANAANGHLRAVVVVPDIAVVIAGTCSALGTRVRLDGTRIDHTTIALSMELAPAFPGPDPCAHGLTASATHVQIASLDLHLHLGGCGLLCDVLAEPVGHLAEDPIRDFLQGQVQDMIAGAIGPALADVDVLTTHTSMNFFGASVDVGICLTGMGSEGGALVATLGASAMGPGGDTDAPGAPYLPATRAPLAPGAVAIDPALLGQLLFSAWRAGALRLDAGGGDAGSTGIPLTVDVLAGLVPSLRARLGGEIPRGAPLDVGFEVTMAPLVRAATPMEAASGAQFFLELGDVRLRLGTGGADLFVLTSTVRLGLSLAPDASGGIAPTLVREATTSTTSLAETTLPGVTEANGQALGHLVDSVLPSQIAPLLAGAAFSLPDLGAPLAVASVDVDPGGELVLGLAP
jgi:hypothetical protein